MYFIIGLIKLMRVEKKLGNNPIEICYNKLSDRDYMRNRKAGKLSGDPAVITGQPEYSNR